MDDFEDNMELFTLRGDPKRDPRRHVITIVYILNIKAKSKVSLNKDTEENLFFNLKKVFNEFKNQMSFDHYSIIEELIEKKNYQFD